MQVRAIGRLLRFLNMPPPTHTVWHPPQSRTYAKSKTKKPEYKAPTPPISTTQSNPKLSPDAVGSDEDSKAPISDRPIEQRADKSSHPDYSSEQDEFHTSGPSNYNTEPQSSSPSAIDPATARKQGVERDPARPLPDLTQGIPSSFDAETESSSGHADPKSLNITEGPSQLGGQGGGDLPDSAYISSIERRRNRIANYAFGGTILAVLLTTVYAGRNWDNEEQERAHPDAPSGWGLRLFWNRARARYHNQLDYYNEPAFPKLLPNVDPAWERPYTLVLSLEDLLIHSEWTREHGWRMAKRPGVDYFLRYLSQYYELVIFTSIPSMSGGPILQKLDPYKVVMWPLFREATRYRKGQYIKVSRAKQTSKAKADAV